MKLINIKKVYQGSYLSYYIAKYLNLDNNIKKYEFVSRNPLLTIDSFGNHEACGVGIIAFSNEETGIKLNKIIDVLPEAYVSAATIDETLITIVGIGEGIPRLSDSYDEEISTKWYTKEEVKDLFDNKELMSVRTQLFLYKWINEWEKLKWKNKKEDLY